MMPGMVKYLPWVISLLALLIALVALSKPAPAALSVAPGVPAEYPARSTTLPMSHVTSTSKTVRRINSAATGRLWTPRRASGKRTPAVGWTPSDATPISDFSNRKTPRGTCPTAVAAAHAHSSPLYRGQV
jgi:hypothetical protein